MCDTEMKTKQKTWDAMSAEERDALVAEKVMGWTRHPDRMDPTDNRTINGVLYCAPGFEGHNGGSAGHFNVVPSFSASIPAALEVINKLSGEFQFGMHTTCDKGLWDVSVWPLNDLQKCWSVVFAPLAEAICLAALRAKGVV